MYTDDKCTKVATGDSKMTVVLTEKDVTETQVQDGQTVTVVKTYESVTSTCNGGVAGAEIVSTGAACSTIAATAGFCGGQMYDSSKATSKCAGDPCSKTTGSDTAACCKTDPRALCSSIATTVQATEDFCGALIYDYSKVDSKCAGDACDKSKASDTGACCKVDPISVCAKTDGSVMPWAATNTMYAGAPCYCGDNEKLKMCGEGSACNSKADVPCVCTPE